MSKSINSPSYQDIKPYATYAGVVGYRKQCFKYIFCQKGANLSLFVFDPQTDGMTLTNACDFVLEMITNELIQKKIVGRTELQDLLTAGIVALRDSAGEWSTVKVKVSDVLSVNGEYILTGVLVGRWKYLDLTPEYLEIFKLLG